MISTYRKSGRLFILREMAFHEKAGRCQVGGGRAAQAAQNPLHRHLCKCL